MPSKRRISPSWGKGGTFRRIRPPRYCFSRSYKRLRIFKYNRLEQYLERKMKRAIWQKKEYKWGNDVNDSLQTYPPLSLHPTQLLRVVWLQKQVWKRLEKNGKKRWNILDVTFSCLLFVSRWWVNRCKEFGELFSPNFQFKVGATVVV